VAAAVHSRTLPTLSATPETVNVAEPSTVSAGMAAVPVQVADWSFVVLPVWERETETLLPPGRLMLPETPLPVSMPAIAS